MDARKQYWVDCVSEALDEAGVTATPGQIEQIAGVVSGGHESYGMAFGDDVATSNWHARNTREKDALKAALGREREMMRCTTCLGSGREKYSVGPWNVNAHCPSCNGHGKVHPSRLSDTSATV